MALVLLVDVVRVGQRDEGVPVARLHLVRVRVRVRVGATIRVRVRVSVRVGDKVRGRVARLHLCDNFHLDGRLQAVVRKVRGEEGVILGAPG